MNIDLFDGIYDWAVRAIVMKEHPQFYDFLSNQEENPFNDFGRLDLSEIKDFNLESQIYTKAKEFKFTDPK
jgi:hypothetical protein